MKRLSYTVAALACAVALYEVVGQFYRYFHIAWDEEVRLHDGRSIMVHVDRTFERLGWGDSNGVYRDTSVSFDAGPPLGRITRKFERYQVLLIENQAGKWYLNLQGTTGSPPKETVNPLFPVLILSVDGTERSAQSWDDIPDFPQLNVMPLTPSADGVRDWNGKVLTWDVKMAHWSRFPRAAQDDGKIIQRHSKPAAQ